MAALWKLIPVMWHAPAPVAAIQFCGYDEGVGVGVGTINLSIPARLSLAATAVV